MRSSAAGSGANKEIGATLGTSEETVKEQASRGLAASEQSFIRLD